MMVAAHETLHALKRQRPDLYQALARDVRADFDRYILETLPPGSVPPKHNQEEFLADFLADQLARPKFWDQLAEQDPSTFARFARWLNSVLTSIKAQIQQGNRHTEAYTHDLDLARKALADALVRFKNRIPSSNFAEVDPDTGEINFFDSFSTRDPKAAIDVANPRGPGPNERDITPFHPLCSGPKAAPMPSRRKQIPSSKSKFLAAARPRIISDQGAQFRADDFKRFVTEIEATHVMTSPYYPQSNGKLERFHRTLKEHAYQRLPLDLDDGRRIITEMITYYNGSRLHSAIDYVTPHQCLHGLRDNIVQNRREKHRQAAAKRRAHWKQKLIEPGPQSTIMETPEKADARRAEERRAEQYLGQAAKGLPQAKSPPQAAYVGPQIEPTQADLELLACLQTSPATPAAQTTT